MKKEHTNNKDQPHPMISKTVYNANAQKNPTDYGNLRGPPKPIPIEAKKQGHIIRDYFKGSIRVVQKKLT